MRLPRPLVFLALALAVTAHAAAARFVFIGGGAANFLSIQSVACDQTSFTALQPNATVCNIQVVMSGGSFTGTYQISGTDANTNFLLSGSTITQIAGAGTPAGTYTHLTITVTQPQAANSPQSFSPTLVGSVLSGVFDNAGAPWPFYSKVPAINYDLGGQGHGYNVPSPSMFCTNGATSYRADSVDFKASTFDGAIPFQIGCNFPPNSYSYSINISAGGGGPYTCTIQTADTSSGGSWNILLDTPNNVVSNVLTSNTGSFSTFASTTSGSFNASLGNHLLTFAWATGDASFNGSGDFLSWQCQAAGVGPPPPSPPAPAVLAGFTTLADNFDFSNSLYSVRANWLDCPNTNGNHGIWHAQNYGTGVTNNFPCNFTQVADPSTGETVMRISYLTSYDAFGLSGALNIVGAATYNIADNYVTKSYPSATYIESSYRLDGVYPDGGNPSGGPNGVWWWQTTGGDGSGASPYEDTIECDFTEVYAGQGGFANAQCGNHANGVAGLGSGWESYAPYSPYGSSNLPAGWSLTAFHKYGMLYTTNGSSEVYACMFVDDILQSCAALAPDAAELNRRMWLIMGVNSYSPPTPIDINLYIKYIHVFSCASWATTQCFGPTLTNATQDGRTLTYFH